MTNLLLGTLTRTRECLASWHANLGEHTERIGAMKNVSLPETHVATAYTRPYGNNTYPCGVHIGRIRALTVRLTLRRPDLNPVDLRIICRARHERDGNRTGIVSGGEEGLLRRCIFRSSRSKDVVIIEHLFIVDVDAEEPFTRRGPVGFREVEIDDVRAARREAWNRIGHRSVSVGLIDSLRRGVGEQRRVYS